MSFFCDKKLIDKNVIIETVAKPNSLVLKTFIFTCEWSLIEWVEFDLIEQCPLTKLIGPGDFLVIDKRFVNWDDESRRIFHQREFT